MKNILIIDDEEKLRGLGIGKKMGEAFLQWCDKNKVNNKYFINTLHNITLINISI